MITTQNLSENHTTKSVEKIPVWEKLNLTIAEAAAYSNIGVNKIHDLAREPGCTFVLRVGSKKLIKRKEFEKYLTVRCAI